MRILLLSLLALVWTMPAFGDAPKAGDVIFYTASDCSFRHLDPATGSSHIFSQLGCGGLTVGTGPTNWSPADSTGSLYVRPDGWIYSQGSSGGAGVLYRIDPATGNRKLVSVLPDATFGLTFWPEPSFFTLRLAALSIGAGLLLVGVLAGLARRGAIEGTFV